MRYHNKAIVYFKKQLQLAWEQNDQKYEIDAYENLSIDNYYLDKMSQSSFYNKRAWTGTVEQDNSLLKKMFVTLLRMKRDLRFGTKTSNANRNRLVDRYTVGICFS